MQQLNPRVNVRVSRYERQPDGSLVFAEQRETHNVMTTYGRAWLATRLGASAYTDPPTPVQTSVIQYVGFGVGGYLQTNTAYRHQQYELASVQALEDATPVSKVGSDFHYLKQLETQDLQSTVNFPGGGRSLFVCNLLETEISFVGAVSATSLQPVGTAVPISEAALYLSDATVGSYENVPVCYDTFDPIMVTPNAVIRIEWEIRFG